MGAIIAEGAVLVLHLHHHDVPSAGRLTLGDHGDQHVEPRVDLGEVPRIARAQPQTWLGQQPPGEPAVLPFGADVGGAGPDDRVQAELVRDVEEPAEIREAVEEGGLAAGG